MDKIVPIISLNNNPVIKRYWIVKSGDMLRDINNTKLPMSNEHRNNVCDAYLEIINKEDQDNYTRIKAIESWSVAENRRDKIISNVENISKNKILFKNTAFYLYRGHRTPEEVTNKMLNILENSNKYPEEITDGALNFLGRASTSDDTVLISFCCGKKKTV